MILLEIPERRGESGTSTVISTGNGLMKNPTPVLASGRGEDAGLLTCYHWAQTGASVFWPASALVRYAINLNLILCSGCWRRE